MCNNGYKGRVGIYQVMPITEEIQRIILVDGMALDIAKQAQREGVRDLRQSGLAQGALRHDHAGRSDLGHQRVATRIGKRDPGDHMATALAAKQRIKDIVFEWEGKDQNGKPVRGEMRAGGEARSAPACAARA